MSKKLSLIEALTNTIAGLLTSFGIQLIIYPTMNIPVTISQNIVITCIFFMVSVGRSYLIRRLFTRFK